MAGSRSPIMQLLRKHRHSGIGRERERQRRLLARRPRSNGHAIAHAQDAAAKRWAHSRGIGFHLSSGGKREHRIMGGCSPQCCYERPLWATSARVTKPLDTERESWPPSAASSRLRSLISVTYTVVPFFFVFLVSFLPPSSPGLKLAALWEARRAAPAVCTDGSYSYGQGDVSFCASCRRPGTAVLMVVTFCTSSAFGDSGRSQCAARLPH